MIIRKIIKWIVGIVASILILLVIGTFLLNTKSVQQWLLKECTKALSEKLNTKVHADSVSVNLFLMQMSLYGLSVDDRQGCEMLTMQRFDGDVSMKSIFQMRLVVNKVETNELTANLIKERTDSAANFQFVIDELGKKTDKETKWEDKQKKNKVKIDFRHLIMNNTQLNYKEPSGKAKASIKLLDVYVDDDDVDANIEDLKLAANGINLGKNKIKQAEVKIKLLDVNIEDEDVDANIDELKMAVNGISIGKNKIKQAELNISLKAEATLGDDLEAEVDMKRLDFKWPEKIIDFRGLTFEAEADNHSAQIEGLSLNYQNYNCKLPKIKASIPHGQKWEKFRNLNVIVDGISIKDQKTANQIRIEQISASMSKGNKLNLQHAALKGLKANLITTKQSITASLSQLKADMNKGKYAVAVNGLRLATDNHKPRRNTGKPKRGWFDAGHLSISSNMNWTVNLDNNGSVNAQLNNATIKDPISGIDIKNMKMMLTMDKGKAHINNLSFQQASATTLNIASADITLPSKKEGRQLTYQTGTISGHVILADISHAFSKALIQFRLPLKLTASMSGNQNAIHFSGVRVNTADLQLTVTANGDITHLREKHKVAVRFHSVNMIAKVGMPEKIINQFPVKKLMMNQLHKLGDIGYKGQFEVVNKCENFQGVLTTKAGPIDVSLTIDNAGKWVTGNVATEALNIGKVLDMENIGEVKAKASFKVDISKERTAKMRQLKGGKLPIGTVSATVDDCSYKKVHVRNLEMQLESDGAVANGTLIDYGKHLDLSCQFSFTDTDQMNKMKIKKAGMKLHKKTEKEKEEKEMEKMRKQEEKNKKKEEKMKAKEEERLLKEEEKLRKDEEKMQRKEEKAKAKEEEKLRKEEEKLRKEEEKLRKKEEKMRKREEKKKAKEEKKKAKEEK